MTAADDGGDALWSRAPRDHRQSGEPVWRCQERNLRATVYGWVVVAAVVNFLFILRFFVRNRPLLVADSA